MTEVEKIRKELEQMGQPHVSINPTEEEKRDFAIYMSKREELAEAMAKEKSEKESQILRKQVKELIDRKKVTISAIATAIGYSRSALSMYMSGSYSGNVDIMEKRLSEYLREEGVDSGVKKQEGMGGKPALPARKLFFESRDARAIMGVCQSCQEYMGLGIVVGRSGYGKTHTLKRYAKMAKVAYIECDDTMSSRDLIEAIEQALGIPNGYGTNWKRINGIRDFFNTNKGYLLIIDEADKLVSKYTQKKMEILRGIYDQADVGIVIAGEPKLEAQIKTYLQRMANRVDFYASLSGLNGAEVEEYLEGYEIDAPALAELKARACNSQTGCFRLLDRTMQNIRRLTDDNRITMKLIEKASGMMML